MKRLLFLILLLTASQAPAQISLQEAEAFQYYDRGEFEKALPLYQKLFNQSQNPAYYEPYFTALLRLKKYAEAEKLLKNLLKRQPEQPIYQVDYGRLLQERGEQEKARTWYDQLIRALPKNESAIRDLSNTFYRAEAYDYCIKTLQAGRALLNDPSLFSFELISLYRFQKNKEMLTQEFLNTLGKNPKALTQAQNILSSTLESEDDFNTLKEMVLNRLQRFPQNVAYTELLIWVLIQQKQFDQALKQTIALDRRLKENGQRVYELTYVLINNKNYPAAVEGLNYLINKGPQNPYYVPAKTQLLNTQYQQLMDGTLEQEKLLQLEKEYFSLLEEAGYSNNTAFAVRQLASLQAFYLKKSLQAIRLLEKYINTRGLSPAVLAQSKLELADIYVLNDEFAEATLLYGQVEKQSPDEPIGHEAKFKSARLSYYQGDFAWAKAQLDVLKSSTSQLIANDALNLSLLIAENTISPTDSSALGTFARAELLALKNQDEESFKIMESIGQKFPGNSLADDILMAKAKLYLKQKKYPEALQPLQLIIEQHGFDLWADDAVFMTAELYEKRLNSPAKARELYLKLITDYPASLHVNEARKKYRESRGDKVEE